MTLTNFMAHASTILELAPGLNVLCGPNNTGKSAVVEALRCLANNPSPRHYIRHGASEARVEALLDDGWRVAWVRRKAHALYEVYAPGQDEPQVFAKLGRSMVPPEVAKLVKLAPVGFDKGDEVDVHLGDQRHPIFLLDKPGSLMADFLASSTESAHLMAMQDALREKTRRMKTEQRKLEEAAERARSGLDRLSALPGVSLSLERLREDGRVLQDRAARMPAVQADVERMERLTGEARTLRSRTSLLGGLAKPPSPAPAADLAATLAAVDALRSRSASIRATLARLAPLAAPGGLRLCAPLADACAQAGSLRALKARASGRLAALAGLSPPPGLPDPAPLAGLVESMDVLAGRIAKGRAWLVERETALSALSERIAARLAEVGECPLCGAGLDAAKFLRKAGGHGAA
nr:AAA family ATPase [Fundidesulfovibrio terrae]